MCEQGNSSYLLWQEDETHPGHSLKKVISHTHPSRLARRLHQKKMTASYSSTYLNLLLGSDI